VCIGHIISATSKHDNIISATQKHRSTSLSALPCRVSLYLSTRHPTDTASAAVSVPRYHSGTAHTPRHASILLACYCTQSSNVLVLMCSLGLHTYAQGSDPAPACRSYRGTSCGASTVEEDGGVKDGANFFSSRLCRFGWIILHPNVRMAPGIPQSTRRRVVVSACVSCCYQRRRSI